MANDIKTQATKGVIWSFVERFSVQGVSFLITLIMARILTPSDYGLIGMLAIFMSLSQVFIDGGFASALIQKKSCTNKDFSTVFYTNIAISIVIYISLFIGSPFIADFYNQEILCSITRVYTVILIVNSLSAVNNTILTIQLNFKMQSLISLLSAIISGVLGILSAFKGLGVWAIVVQQMSASILRVILSFYYVRWFPDLTFSISSFKSLFGFGSKLLISSIISNLYVNIYNLFIGKKFSSAQLGYYTRATQFETLVSSNISSILTRVSYPVLSKFQDNDEVLVNVYRKYITLSAFIMFPIVLMLASIAKPLVIVLLTDKWSECITLIQILSFAYVFDGISVININLLSVKGRSDLVLRLEIIKKSIAFSILFISMFFDLNGICIGLVIYGCIAIVLNTMYTGKLLGYGMKKQSSDIGVYLIISTITAIFVAPLGYVISNCYISLFVSLLLYPTIYIGLSKMFNLSAYNKFVDILTGYVKNLK